MIRTPKSERTRAGRFSKSLPGRRRQVLSLLDRPIRPSPMGDGVADAAYGMLLCGALDEPAQGSSITLGNFSESPIPIRS
jgi:hypothetical protein